MQHENAGEPGDTFSRLFPNHSAEEHHPGGHAIDACQTSGVSPPKLAAKRAAIEPLLERQGAKAYAYKGPDAKHFMPAKQKDGTPRSLNDNLDALLAGHFGEGSRLGMYLPGPGASTVRVAALDLDDHEGAATWVEMQEAARKLIDAGATRGIRFTPFRSSGGRGVHLFAIWDEDQDARSVRALLAAVLTAAGFKNGTGGVAKQQVEIFPKADSVPADGWGNLIAYPGNNNSAPLDPPSLDVSDWGPIAWSSSDPVPFVAAPVYTPAAYAGPQQFEKVRSALITIDPNTLGYDDWLRMLFAVHASTGASDEGRALVHEWSAKFSRYTPEETDKQWAAAKIKPGGIGWGTLRHAALAAGWCDPDTGPSGFDVFAVDIKAETDRLSAVFTAGAQTEEDARSFATLPPAAQTEVLNLLDLADDGAAAAARAAIERAKGQVRCGRFTAIPAGEFAKRPRTGWRIKGVLPATGVAMIFGQPGSGKSFLALDICAAIARGEPWRARKVTKGRVLYVAAEAQGGISARLEAYLRSNALDGVPGLWVVGETPNFHSGDADDRAISGIAKSVAADVIVIDTLAAATAGADENTAKDMNAVMGRLNAIREATGGLVVLVHHSGKDESKGARGWSGMKGAVDTEVEVTRPDEEQPARVARVTKQKEGESGQVFGFELAVVELGIDEDGDPVTSCVVRAIDEVPVKRGKKRDLRITQRRPSGQYQQAAYDHAFAAGGPVHLDELLDVIVARMPPPEDGRRDQRRSNARREIDKLINGDFLEVAPGGCLRLRGTGEGL